MLIVRVALVVKDRLHGRELTLRIQPGIHVLGLDIDNRSVMPAAKTSGSGSSVIAASEY